MTSGVCPYCNSLTTFPKITDSRMEQLYARAEQFRRNSDFDKAVFAYDQLIQMDPENPEYYWGAVISRNGIEYVEDPVSHERVPTCHRVQYDSILADTDYQIVLSLSSGYDRDIYEKEAKRIAEIQKGILTISAQEKPYDVFICYKETTDGRTRTKDCTLAQDIYYRLTNIGCKVFFARITLEGKLGQQYEPYIFAALNSAKVMLVIGSKKEFFEAVWVRNEWSRFLALMKKDRTKLLIPCYSGMDPYDLPTELSMFQAQDMSKIGFLLDLIHGIKKVMGQEDARKNSSGSPASVSTQAASADSVSADKLLKRVEFFLTDRNFDKAEEYCNKILDTDPDNLEAYFYQLLVTMQMTDEMAWPDQNDQNPEELSCCKKILASDNDVLKQRVENVLKSCRLGKALIKYGSISPENDEDGNSVG
ncbi:MAG: toll/interleukin-1 receptor domain-containing protein, partial [Lentisphaeria bacterium]|nr:toll/interleukin-1 receptor domain-containing protein [Lentisphaeria bacterium]